MCVIWMLQTCYSLYIPDLSLSSSFPTSYISCSTVQCLLGRILFTSPLLPCIIASLCVITGCCKTFYFLISTYLEFMAIGGLKVDKRRWLHNLSSYLSKSQLRICYPKLFNITLCCGDGGWCFTLFSVVHWPATEVNVPTQALSRHFHRGYAAVPGAIVGVLVCVLQHTGNLLKLTSRREGHIVCFSPKPFLCNHTCCPVITYWCYPL